jgi:hypothetical protein
MALKTSDDDQKLNPGQTGFDDLVKREKKGDFDDIVNHPDMDDLKQKGNEIIEQAQQGEDTPGFVNNFTGANNKDGGGAKFAFKKKGPIGALIAIVFGGGFGVVGLFGGPSLILVQVEETFTGDARLNTQLTSMTVRTDKMLATKFNESTDGVCGTKISILCRYSRPSNYLMKQMKKSGITVVDASGAPIEPNNNPFPNKRPGGLQFTDSSGKTKTIAAADLLSELNNNPEFRAAFRKAYNPRFVSLADSVFSSIKKRFGFNGQDKNKDADSPDKVKENLTEESAGPENGVKGALNEGEDASKTLLQKLLGDKLGSMLQKLGQSGKGDAVGLVAGVACMATDIPGAVIKVVRAYQMAQVIKYAATFLVVAGAIKAGDANQNETAALGTALTTVVAGKTAMDSFGMRNALFGDTNALGSTSYKSFSPGHSVLSIPGFATTASVLDSGIKQDVCTAVGNPITGGVINAALGPETLGIGTVINIGLGIAGAAILQTAGPTIASAIVGAIPPEFLTGIMNTLLGNLTANLSGQDVGDALSSGAENMMSQTANAGGNVPMTVSQAVAYNKVTTSVNLAYAQEDRVTHSPLDASNPNTALGSFVNQFMPYYADMLSASGIFSMIGSIVSSPLSILTAPSSASAADEANAYNQCDDPLIQSSKTAATPFCAISYGVPSQYLDIDPMQVMQDLQASGDIDEEGNPTDDNAGQQVANTVIGEQADDVSTLKHWMDLCTDGTTDTITATVNACQIDPSQPDSKKLSEYALYTIDHRIQQTMDGEDSAVTGGSSSSSSSSDTSAYNDNSTQNNLFAYLDAFNQPQPTIPQTLPTNITPVPQSTPSTVLNKMTVAALPMKRFAGVMG